MALVDYKAQLEDAQKILRLIESTYHEEMNNNDSDSYERAADRMAVLAQNYNNEHEGI